MRRMTWGCLVLLAALSGCSSRFLDFSPDEDAIYDQPLDEVWPLVRTYFQENGFVIREAPGRASLQTEWREEFVGSRVAGYWHRYLVVARPEGPHRSTVVITRDTRSANKALRPPGADLLWSMDGRTDDNPTGLGSDTSAILALQQADGSAVILGESAQTARDLTLEWKIFRKLSPLLARTAKKSGASVDVAVLKDSTVECGVPILGLARLAHAGNVVLLGELHGTEQVPHFVAQSTCQIATQGIPVTVGLEMPSSNQERLETFLGSAGREQDWAKLMESPFWRSPYPDGRGSEAVAYLIEALRKLRTQGLDVTVFAFDHPALEGDAREEALAREVLDRAGASGKRVMLVVSGNLHPRQIKGVPWNADYRPMGLRIADVRDNVYSLDIAYKSGTAWICAVGADQKLDCGVKSAKGQDNGDRYFVNLFGGRNSQGYQGFYYVGEVTASLPAVYNGVEPAGESHPVAPVSGR